MRCEAVRESDQPAGELSYWLVPQARGRGLAYAAVRLMIDSVVPGLGLRSVVLDIEEGNLPSVHWPSAGVPRGCTPAAWESLT